MYKRQTRLPTFCTSLFSSFSSTHQRIPAQVCISNMSSWDLYISDLLMDPDGKPTMVQDAAICGFTPGAESVWASSPGLTGITVEEIRELVDFHKDFRKTAVNLGGKKCLHLRTINDNNLYMCTFKTIPGDDGEPSQNVCVGMTLTAFVIAFGTKDAAGGALSDKVYKMVEYLRGSKM